MIQKVEGPPRGGDCADGPEVVCLAVNASDIAQNPAPAQAKNRQSEITCASMRADELREGLVCEITRAAAIGNQAIMCLLDGYDEAAIEALRQHWIVMRAGIAPLATELNRLNREAVTPARAAL
jgi:hypothetical protein